MKPDGRTWHPKALVSEQMVARLRGATTAAFVLWSSWSVAACSEPRADVSFASDENHLSYGDVGGGATVTSVGALVKTHTLIVPDTTARTEWLGRIDRLRFDASTGNLLAMDRQLRTVIEFDSTGGFVYAYGGAAGQGPGEIRELSDFDYSERTVIILDRGNQKVLVFERLGELQHTFRASGSYRDIALGESNEVLVVPGTEGSAIDRFTLDGGPMPGLGDVADLPVGCSKDDACDRARELCLGCSILSASGLLVIWNDEESLALFLGPDPGTIRRIDLAETYPAIAGWRREDEPLLAEMHRRQQAAAIGGHRVQVIKSYLHHVDKLLDGRLAVSVVPSILGLRRSGFEYWLLEPSDLSVERYSYGDVSEGRISVGWPATFAVNRRSGGVERLKFEK